MKNKNTKRSVRPENPMPLALTQRDKDMLARIWQDKLLYASQIRRIFFNSKSAANMRLHRLWENGYLERCFLPTLILQGLSEALYFLDKKGVDTVSTGLGIERTKVLQGIRYLKWKVNTKSFLLTLDHTLAVAEFRIAFEEACRIHDGIKFERWVSERECQDEYRFRRAFMGKLIGKFRPDGFVQYRHDGRMFSSFVEVDLATMSNKAFEEKVQRYMDYSKSGGYEKRYKAKYFRVLVATVGGQRLENLKRTTEKLTDSIFWFTTLGQICKERLFDKVWQRAGKDGLYSLLDKI
jgi:hypothetical protein